MPPHDKTKSNATQAYAIARVSSEGQEEYSPAAQNKRIKDYCDREKLNILKTFEITESSTKGDRKEFMDIIKDAKKSAKKSGQPIAIVTDKVDRLQRGFKQQSVLETLREDGLLEYHFSSDNCVIHKHSPATDLFMWNISVALAQNYTDSLRDNVNRAKEQKLASGEWVAKAPVGYINWRDDRYKTHGRGRAEIKIDPIRAPLVRQLFEKYATGCFSINELTKLAKAIGLTNSTGKQLPLSRANIHRMLQNPFYHGIMRLRSTGETFPHNYERIISKELFNKCQDIRTGKSKPHARYGRKQFLFRGIMTCAQTGKLCTAQTTKRHYKNGKTAHFTYLVSFDKNDPKKMYYTREDDIIRQVEAALDSLTLWDQREFEDVLSYIRKTYFAKRTESRLHMQQLRREISDIEYKIDRLTDLRLDGELTPDEFMAQKERLKDRYSDINGILEAHNITDDKFTDKLSYLVSVASKAVEEFRSSGFDQKRALLQYVFQNLQLDGKKIVFSMASPFDVIAECNKTEKWCTLVDTVQTCDRTREAISSRLIPYWQRRKVA